jgi:hypothetical protein
MFTLFTDDQIRRNDIDTLKHWLRPKLDGYGVAIKKPLTTCCTGACPGPSIRTGWLTYRIHPLHLPA